MKNWPTPVKSDCQQRRKTKNWEGGDLVSTVTELVESQGVMQPKAGGQLSPEWVEWLMGWPVGWTSLEPMTEVHWLDWSVDPADEGNIPRTASNIPDRIARLKAIGNGQVPAVAAVAWETMA